MFPSRIRFAMTIATSIVFQTEDCAAHKGQRPQLAGRGPVSPCLDGIAVGSCQDPKVEEALRKCDQGNLPGHTAGMGGQMTCTYKHVEAKQCERWQPQKFMK